MTTTLSTPRFAAGLDMTIGGRRVHYEEENMPQEAVDVVSQLAGNGLAKVRVEVNLAIKDFGTGAGATVSIETPCSNTEASIQQAAEVLAPIAMDFAKRLRDLGVAEVERTMAERQGSRHGTPNYR